MAKNVNKGPIGQQIRKMLVENRLPRLLIFTLICVKMTTIYDKLKQLVAINNIYSQIVNEQRVNLRSAFNLSEDKMDSY